MRKILVGFLVLAIGALGANVAAAKGGKGKGHHAKSHHAKVVKVHKNKGMRGLAHADARAHRVKAKNYPRTRGANSPGFCPPGQEKKPGLGSRFQC